MGKSVCCTSVKTLVQIPRVQVEFAPVCYDLSALLGC